MSHHYKVLRESGLTRTRLAGTQRFMSLRKKELEERFPGLLDSVLNALDKERRPEIGRTP
jgi:DNA-binding transcriptional ArsR family regulator